MYSISSPGHLALPDELSRATEEDVDDVLLRAAAFLGRDDIEVRRVSSVIGGSCIACVDIVVYASGTPLLIAQPALY